MEQLRSEFERHGQGHCLQHWDKLTQDQRSRLVDDLSSINLDEVTRYFADCAQDMHRAGEKVAESDLQPLPTDCYGSIVRTDDNKLLAYQTEGLRQISEGRVAVLLLSGGQGTRLGVPYPKGMYDVGLPSHKTLFQLQAERILHTQDMAQRLTGQEGVVPWYIMTSEHTGEATKNFFEKHDYFGLKPENVVFFEQETLPCMSFDGKIIMETPYKVARAPDGNGGLYRAMDKSGILADMLDRGILYTQAYCVDNILVKMPDPHFIGFCIQKGAQCGAKVVEKVQPTEAVGIICQQNGKYRVVEYSEITLHTAEKRNPDGRLTFSAGGICIHFFSTEFLKDVIRKHIHELTHHVAKKKIPHVAPSGETVKPTEPNGIKMEKFIFDVFPFSEDKFAVWEVLREDEFSPLKNADSAPSNNPTTCRHAIFNLHTRHVIKAGGAFIGADGLRLPHIPDAVNGNGECKNSCRDETDETIVCEISPKLSVWGEGIEELVKGKTFRSPLVLTADSKDGKQTMIVDH